LVGPTLVGILEDGAIEGETGAIDGIFFGTGTSVVAIMGDHIGALVTEAFVAWRGGPAVAFIGDLDGGLMVPTGICGLLVAVPLGDRVARSGALDGGLMVPTGTGTCGLFVAVPLDLTGALEGFAGSGALGEILVTFVANGAIVGTFPKVFVGSNTGVLVVALYIHGALIGALGVIPSGDLIGAGAVGGDFQGAFVEDRIGPLMAAKFHFGPMYLHPFFPYSMRPGQSLSLSPLFAGPLPH
jgi:hypothetical protein